MISGIDCRELRRNLYDELKSRYATAPIRLMSKIDQEARVRYAESGSEYEGYAGAIGDIAADSLSPDLRHALYFGREAELRACGEKLLKEETRRYTSYDYTGSGFNCLKELWKSVYRPFSESTDALNPYIFYGGTHAFSMTIKALSRIAGDLKEVLVPVPSFPPFFFQLSQYFDLHCLKTSPESGFRLQAEQIAPLSRDSLALVYLCVVGNPTGLAYEADELLALCRAITAKNPAALLLFDAVYLRTLEPAHTAALWQVMTAPEFSRNAVIFESLSKNCGRTGLRSGVVFLRNEALEQSLIDLMQNEMAGVSYAMQLESAGLLSSVGNEAVQALAGEIAGRRHRFLTGEFAKFADFILPMECQPLLPHGSLWQGGMYAFIRLRDNIDPVEFFIETGVACVPGKAFSGPVSAPGNYIRISFGMEAM